MQGYEAVASYKLIYIFEIPDEAHNGLLKIGETTFESGLSPNQLLPNCETLNTAAHNRIRQYTRTALIRYNLLHTELAERTIVLRDGVQRIVTFSDNDVHRVLDYSRFRCQFFYDSGQRSEWYEVDLPTAINAIRACKENRATLSESERHSLHSTQKTTVQPEIIFRGEQLAAVAKTVSVFKKDKDMLWDCKMRFGKTLTAYKLCQDMKFQRILIVTHRPAVVDGWQSDFDKLYQGSDYTFLTKVKTGGSEVVFDEQIDANNARTLRNQRLSGRPFFYFASVQDLRDSKCVGGHHHKNEAVFEMDWDFIIYDEAHEGTQTELGHDVQRLLEKAKNGVTPKVLHLSGTPYNIQEKFGDRVYSWDYVMEQKAKREWAEKYPNVHNPYADLPEMRMLTFDLKDSMPTSYRFEREDMAFNFYEFFRTWTGDPKKDFRPLPSGAHIGDFVHEDDVNSFLNLLTTTSEDSYYPFSRQEYRDMFRHTFWIVPGVKEAKALSKLLKEHPVFGRFEVANVAGDGDEEQPYDDALKLVRDVIENNDYTITISCGKLTTGVTVPEWTAVMMLTGGATVAASSYMQTIFRVQSAGSINGKQKERCYVFDFAPDRALNVLSEVHNLKRKGKRSDESGQAALGEFLNFCPVISVSGTGMTTYDVSKMMRQIKRLTVDKAIKSGFDDESVYRADTGIVMKEDDIILINQLGGIVEPQKQGKKSNKVVVNGTGLTEEEYGQAKKASRKPPKTLTEEEKALLEKLKQQQKDRKKVVNLLRNISIRLPMLIYGADKELTEEIRMSDFVTMVDDESWEEFMPKGISKLLFKKLLKYYDEDVVMGAGLRIRRMAKAADELPPSKRVQRIAEIFNHFRSPDKETVLTPWRVVNLHMSDMLGGYSFYDESFAQPDGLLDEPRLVDRGDVTADLFLNSDVRILEMNSKSGLYPLYLAYSIYAMRLPEREELLSLEQTQALWQEVLSDNVFVLCKTKMARFITIRTLAGYTGLKANAIYLTKLLERMNDQKRLSNKLKNPKTWDKEGEKMKFDAIVGNPPYQQNDGGGKGYSAKPIYNLFVDEAKAMEPRFISMITPSRWFAGGKGLDDFRANMLHDVRLEKIVDYIDSSVLFSNVSIVGGINYFLWNCEHNGLCEVTSVRGEHILTIDRNLNEYDIFIRNNQSIRLIKHIENCDDTKMNGIVFARNVFGIPSDFRGKNKPDESHSIALFCSQKSNSMTSTYISEESVQKEHRLLNKYKVIIGKVVPRGGEVGVDPSVGYRVISTIQVLSPNSAFTDSYLLLGVFETKEEALNFAHYMTLKLPRFLLHETYSSMNISKENFRFVPYLDYTQKWTDEMLYERYHCTDEEIQMIESMMRPLEYVVHE